MTFTKLYDVAMRIFVRGSPEARTELTGLLLCYVHESGEIRGRGGMGHSTLRQIFVSRPDKCRFAVVKQWGDHDTYKYVVVDLYDVYHTEGPEYLGVMFYLGNHWEFSTEDAAMACALMQL